MTSALLLFDIDGTLLTTGKAGLRAMGYVAQKLFGDQFSFDGVEVSGRLDPLIFAEAATMNGLDRTTASHDAFRDHYIDRLRQELIANQDRVRAAEGVHDTLAMLRRRKEQRDDVVLGLLTGNYTRAVPIKLNAVGIDPGWFEVTAFGDEAATRADLVPVAIAKHTRLTGRSSDPDRVVIIGDTPHDVACAQAHGCVAFAVATGCFSQDQLRDAGADIVVSDLIDSTPLVQLIDSITT